MGALLALTSAVCYGIVVPQLSTSLEPGGAPIAGGLLSRHIHHTAVTFFGQVGGLLLACAAALLMPAACCGAPCPASAAASPCASSTAG